MNDNGAATVHYDDLGNRIESDTPQGNIHYVFDPVTGEHTETYTANTDIVYGYDNQGRLITTTVKKLNGTLLTTPLVTTDTYDAVGNKKTETLPNGVETDYTCDDLNRLNNVVEKKGTTTLFSETYILNSDGTRGSSNDTDANGVSTASTWTYDADDRLTGEAVTSSTSANSFSDSYTYDLNGNRISDVHTGAGGDANGANATTTNTYNGDDQLKTSTITPSGGSPTLTDYTYDANGSELTVTDHASGTTKSSFTYDVRNKMTGVNANGLTTTFVYDDAGNRVGAIVITASGTVITTQYLTDTNNPTGYTEPLEVRSSATSNMPVIPSKTYLLGDRVFGQIDDSNNLGYLLIDGHGSTRQLTNANGTVTATFHYDAFGGAIAFTPATAPTVFLFGGDAVYDPASGLYLHGDGTRARSGFRFIQADTQGHSSNSDPITLHRYLYADDDPSDMDDPTGHEGELVGTLGAISLISSFSGIFGGIAGGYQHGIRGAIGGFVGSFAGTSVSLASIAPLTFVAGPLGVPASFGIGSAIQTVIEKLFVDGEGALEERSTWIEVTEAFFIGAGLGSLGGATTQFVKNEIAENVASIEPVWNLLGQIQNETVDVIDRDLAESGITQDLGTIIGKYAPRFKTIMVDLLKDNARDTVTESVITYTVQTFVELTDDLFFKRSGDPSLSS